MKCLNCNFMLNEDNKFCPQCGQNTSVKRLSSHTVAHDAIHSLTHADKGFLHLLVYLPIRPGTIARRYVNGERKKYFNPFTFLIITIGITAFFSANFNLLAPSTSDLGNPVSIFMSKHINLIIFLTVPIIGFCTVLLFRKEKINFAESLILSCYTSGIRSVFFVVLVTPLIIFFREFYIVITSLYLLAFAIYYAFACCQYFSNYSIWYWVKGFLVMVLTQFVISFGVGIGIYIYFLIQK